MPAARRAAVRGRSVAFIFGRKPPMLRFPDFARLTPAAQSGYKPRRNRFAEEIALRHRLYVVAALAGLAIVVVAAAALAKPEIYNDLSIYREETVVTSQYPSGQQTTAATRVWVKGPKMRTEVASSGEVTIVRADLDKVYMINAVRRIYSETPLAIYRKAQRVSLAMLGVDPTYTATNRERKIGHWKCREVVVAEQAGAGGDSLKTIWWMSDDPSLEKRLMRHVMSVSMGLDLDETNSRFFEKLAGIPGYPVQTETTMTHGGTTVKTVNTLQKMERREINDSQFELPEGLTKMNMPPPDGMQ